MKYTKGIYFALIFFIVFVTYEQYLGLNALLIPVLLSLVHYFLHRDTVNMNWAMASILWTLSGLGIFLWHLDIGVPLYVITGLNYFAASHPAKQGILTSILQAVISFFTGIGRFFNSIYKAYLFGASNKSSKKLTRSFLLIAIPLLLFTIFLKLYQFANFEFAELTAFLNFEFLEMPFFIYFGFLSVFAFGFFFFKPSQRLLKVSMTDSLVAEKLISQEAESKASFEWKIGITVVSSLSLLLMLFVAVDLRSTFGALDETVSYSKNVHESMNVLIGSIVLVIIIITYLFRGNLNFKPIKALQALTYIWLILNLVIIFFIVVKNGAYITSLGLTHKRIGVYLYALLCAMGISIAIYKIHAKKTTSYLVNKTSVSFLICLVFYGLVNWNGIIARYNLNMDNRPEHLKDYRYLVNLGPDVYPILIDYIKTHPESNQSIKGLLSYEISAVYNAYTSDWTDFFSYTYSGYKAFKSLDLPIPEGYHSRNFIY